MDPAENRNFRRQVGQDGEGDGRTTALVREVEMVGAPEDAMEEPAGVYHPASANAPAGGSGIRVACARQHTGSMLPFASDRPNVSCMSLLDPHQSAPLGSLHTDTRIL
ncbi:unnamed protein product [Phytophthora lilii]|uniref:Unnamed protein product n=1 Tax=Phytophthora lilii TaxID=2077276 RepID=A0A9W6TFS8_9STRA|nr:unnamed protein product [Phytophthora lilii]